MQIEKVERFKKRIDFEATIRMEKTAPAVNVIWPEMLEAPGLDIGQWKVASDNTWRANSGVTREWVLRRREEQIAIVIFASFDGPRPAQDFLLSRATENMMLDSPFVKALPRLGSLAISMPPGAPSNLIWIFRNLCFDVRNDNSQVDIVPIARWLQSAAETGVAAGTAAGPPLYVSSRQTVVGMPVDIRAQAVTREDEDRYMLDLEFDNHALEVVSQERLAAQIRGRAPGRTTLKLHLIDRMTLLSKRTLIEIEFLPITRR